MSEITDHINHIQTKLQQLLKRYDIMLLENKKQQQVINLLQLEQLQSKEKLEEIKQQNLLLKASVTTMDEGDKKELEQKINQYIKNIDKCISLLSQ